jgi:P-type conjugative transfer protein TrbJ
MKKALRNTVLAALAGSMVMSTANAGSVAGNGGATEVTQILNNVELLNQSAQMYQQVQQTLQQVQMMQQQLKNLVQAPQMIWGQVQADLQTLTQLVAQGQALGYALGNIDQTFATKFPGYSTALKSNFSQQSKNWTQTSLDSLRTALNAAGLQSQQFATEQAAMDAIQSIAAGSPGALQAAQAGVMVASQQVQQLQKLRQLFMAQMQAQNAYLAKQAQQESNDRATMDAHFTPYTSGSPSFQSKGGKN